MNTLQNTDSPKPALSNPANSARQPLPRRQFLKTAAAFGATTLILPRMKLFGKEAPSNKLNIALIATGHRAKDHFPGFTKDNIVAICDVNDQILGAAAQKFPGATKYGDWRKCLDQKDVEAIVCCTPDHHHAFVANWAMNRGKHIYLEKPMGNSVEEVRLLRQTYLKMVTKHGPKIATQVGTQRHAFSNFNRVKEMVRDGAIGELQEVSAWGNRKNARANYLPGEPVPAYLNWDMWIGPTHFHPFNPLYIAGGCLKWNMHWDFGTGQIGDMGAHTMDLAWNAIDAKLPTSAEAKGDPYNPDQSPVKMDAHFDIPANDWRPAIKLHWYQGGAMPDSPHRAIELATGTETGTRGIDHGVMFEGTRGVLIADFNSRILIPVGSAADMTYYKPRPKDKLIPTVPNFEQEWINACKSDKKMTSCNFGYAVDMAELMLLGLVAYRAGKKIQYDGAQGRVTDVAEANEFLAHTYREGWTLNG